MCFTNVSSPLSPTIYMPVSGQKRSAAEAGIKDSSSTSKELCLAQASTHCLAKLGTDLLGRLVTFLHYKDLLHFQAAYKDAALVTRAAWQCYDWADNRCMLGGRIQDFKWFKTTENDPRWNCCLTKALITYVEDLCRCQGFTIDTNDLAHAQAILAADQSLTKYDKVQKIQQRFQSLGERFPLFQEFITISLNCVAGNLTETANDLFIAKMAHLTIKGNVAAQALLGIYKYISISRLNPRPFNAATVSYLIGGPDVGCILERGATWYHLLITKMLGEVTPTNTLFIQELAIQAASYGNYRPLEYAIRCSGCKTWPLNLAYPPILAQRAAVASASDPQLADDLYTQAIKAYAGKAPLIVLCFAFNIKARLNQWQAAYELYTQSIVSHGGVIPAATLCCAGNVCKKLGRYREATALYTLYIESFHKSGDAVSTVELICLAGAYFHLEQFEQAADFYAKALAKGSDGVGNLSMEGLINAGLANRKVGRYAVAAGMYARAMAKCFGNVPRTLLVDTVCVNIHLERWDQVNELMARLKLKRFKPGVDVTDKDQLERLTHLFSEHQERLAATDFALATDLNMHAGQWLLAHLMIDCTLFKAHEDADIDLLEKALTIQVHLKDYAACSTICDQIMLEKGEEVELMDWVRAAYYNVKLKKRDAALVHYKQAMNGNPQGLTQRWLSRLGFISLKLKQYEHAATIYQQVFDRDSTRVTPQVLYNIATVNIHLGRCRLAGDYIDCAMSQQAALKEQKGSPDRNGEKYVLAAVKRLTKAIHKAGTSLPIAHLRQAAQVNWQLESYTIAAELYASVLAHYGAAVPPEIATEAQAVQAQLASPS